MIKTTFLFLIVLLFFQPKAHAQFDSERTWGSYYGGDYTVSEGAVKDSEGNVYQATTVRNAVAPYSETFVTPDAHQTASNDASQICMLTKFNPEGEVVWSTFYGGDDAVTSQVGIDGDNNIYLAGTTYSTTGIATEGAFQSALSIRNDGGNETSGFIAKFNSDGVLQWGTYYPSVIFTFCTDTQGNVYITGSTSRITGISTPNTFEPDYLYPENEESSLSQNGFLSKFDTNGNRVWGTYYGFSNGIGVAVDDFGSVYLAGQGVEEGTGFYATPNCHQSQKGGGFLTKFDDTGNRLWSTYYGSATETTNIYDLQINKDEVYLGGITSSATKIATSGAHQTILAGGIDTFLAKFNIYGERLWGTYYGGESIDFDYIFPYSGKMISFAENDVYFTSSTQSTTGIATTGAFKENYEGEGTFDNFIVKFNKQGERIWGMYYGGSKDESASGVIPIAENSFYIYGTTGSVNNIGTEGSQQPNLEGIDGDTYGVYNAYLARFDEKDLGLDEVNTPQVTLYPNPNHGEFTITHTQGEKVRLYDLQGRLVYQQSAKLGLKHMQINVPQLPAGIYFAVVKKANTQQKTIKVVIR